MRLNVPCDVKHSLAAIDKPHAAGFTPSGSFSEGLKTTIAFFNGEHRLSYYEIATLQQNATANNFLKSADGCFTSSADVPS